MVDRARRAWLKGDFRSPALPVRPPGSIPESRFTSVCDRCDDCIRSCPDKLLVHGDGGYPELDFTHGGCSFCGDCVRACNVGALLAARSDWPWRITLSGDCLSQRGISCRSCSEHCDQSALRFRTVVGGRTLLEIDPALCNGCGACIGACPSQALQLKPLALQETA